MKHFFLLCFLITASLCHANEAIRVVGKGVSEQVALENAFVEAIQIYAGTAVGSGLEVKNGKVFSQETKLYSSGYVEKYQILSSNKTATDFNIVVDVWLKSSVLSHYRSRIDNNKHEIDVDSLNANIKTFLQERKNLDNLISNILLDFPSKGLISKVNKVEFYYDSNRTPTISVNSDISWNQDYILSLKETLNLVKGRPDSTSKRVALTFFKNSSDWYPVMEIFHIRDFEIYDDMVSNFNLQPKLILTLLDPMNNSILHKCFETSQMYTRVERFKDVLHINTAIKENLKLIFPISPKELIGVKTISSVKLATAKTCKNTN